MQVIHSSVTIHKGIQVRFAYLITTTHSGQQSLSHSIQVMSVNLAISRANFTAYNGGRAPLLLK